MYAAALIFRWFWMTDILYSFGDAVLKQVSLLV